MGIGTSLLFPAVPPPSSYDTIGLSASLPSNSVTDHPRAAGARDLIARMLVRMTMVAIPIAVVAELAHVLNHFRLIRATFVVGLGLVTRDRLAAADVRAGD